MQVRCSIEKGDPDNKGGDQPNSGECPGGTGHRLLIPPTSSRHIPIPTLKEMTSNKSPLAINSSSRTIWPSAVTLVLKSRNERDRGFPQNFDDRERAVSNKITHLDYLMSEPGPSLHMDDSKAMFRIGKRVQIEAAYGGYYAKVLAEFRAKSKCGF